jgi:hypothetical protein
VVHSEPQSAKAPLRRILLALLVLVWCAFVLTAYYIAHKPADAEQLAALAHLALTLAGWVGTLALAHGLARLIAPSTEGYPAIPRMTLRLGLGLGVVSLATLVLGAIGGLWRAVPWIAIVGTAPFTIRGLWSDLRQLLRMPIPGGTSRLLALFVGVTVVLGILPALAPPTAWDALVYHLTGPKLYIAAHNLVHNIDIPHLGFPQAAEMLFTWGMLLTGPELAQLFHATFAILTFLLLGSITESFAPGKGWLAIALLAAIPSAMSIAGWAYVEWMTMFAGLASLTLLVWATHGGARGGRTSTAEAGGGGQIEGPDFIRVPASGLRAWSLAGFFAAMALSTKYTAIGVAAGLLIYAAWYVRPRRAVVVFAGTTAIFTLPYLLKNLFLTGNPFYPFFFQGAFWDSLRQSFYSRPGTGLGPIGLLLAPWDATIWGIEGGFLVGHPSYAATIGPLLLILIPLILLRPGRSERHQPWLAAFLLASGAMYLLWLVGLASSHLLLQSRLLFPALPMFVGLAVVGFDSLDRVEWPGFSIHFVVGALIALVLGLTLGSTILTFVADDPLPVITGSESQASYYESRLGLYAWVMDRINLLPDGSRIVFLWEPRSYACSTEVVCEPDAITDRWWHARRLGMTASEIAAAWRSQGVTHVLYYEYGAQVIRDAGVDPYRADDWSELDKFTKEDLEEVENWRDVYVLYRLR